MSQPNHPESSSHGATTSRRAFLLAAGGGLGASAVTPALLGGAEPAGAAASQAVVTQDQVKLPAQSVPVSHVCDVLVCGGGCSGVAAAVSAARHGARVVLVERWPSIGGMATNALVNGWHRSDREKMVIYGLVEESAIRAEKHGWIRKDSQYPRAHETHWFSPEGMRVVWQRMLDEAKVQTLCHLVAGEPIVVDGRLRGVLAETKLGRRALLAKVVIDATGDGDIAAKAAVPCDFGRASDGRVQGMTMMFTLSGVDHSPAVAQQRVQKRNEVMAKMRALRDAGEFPPFNEGNTSHYVASAPTGGTPWNMCAVAGNPLDEEELSRLNARSREQIMAYLDFWRREVPGMQKAALETMGFCLGVRESRRVRGIKTLDADMVLGAVKHRDAIGHGVWMIDIHDPRGSGYTTYTDRNTKTMLQAGTSYHIPLGMCLNAQLPNLAVVGRCASSTHEALASVRVQTHCMVMGQGAGTCAALALERGVGLAQVDLAKLQATLRADGVHLEDVPPA
jgi:hypothetical protein